MVDETYFPTKMDFFLFFSETSVVKLVAQKQFEHRIGYIFLPISFNMVWVLIDMVHLSTHNIC